MIPTKDSLPNANVPVHHEGGIYTVLNRIGSKMLDVVEQVGGISVLAFQSLKRLASGRFQLSLVIQQVYYLGIKSLPLTTLVAIFTGMVLALQFIVGLKRFGLQLYTGQVVGVSIVRELGPVLTSLMIAARVGAGIAAELGSMTVTEQVLAIRALGADPVSKLVLPRVLVVTLVTPVLTIFSDIIGILGGMFVTYVEAGVGPHFYYEQILRTLKLEDFVSGIGKTVFFGFFIGIISCYQGLRASKGTQGVGEATTLSVVMASVSVFVADYFLTRIFLLF